MKDQDEASLLVGVLDLFLKQLSAPFRKAFQASAGGTNNLPAALHPLDCCILLRSRHRRPLYCANHVHFGSGCSCGTRSGKGPLSLVVPCDSAPFPNICSSAVLTVSVCDCTCAGAG